MLTKFSEKTRVVAGSHARHLPISLTHRTVPCATFRPLCYLELPKTWFRTVNGIGAVTDGVLTVDDLIEMFLEEEE